MPALKAPELRFLEEYASTGKLRQSFERAGYYGVSPQNYLNKLLANPAFKKAFTERLKLAEVENNITDTMLTQELAGIAFADISDYIYDDGTLKPLNQIPSHARRAIVGVKTTKVKIDKDQEAVEISGYELADKMQAIQMLGKSSKLKYFTDVTEHHDNVTITHRPDQELISRFVELVRKTGAQTISGRAGTQGENAKVIDVLPGNGAATPGTVPQAS